jgi:hypothetical protein
VLAPAVQHPSLFDLASCREHWFLFLHWGRVCAAPCRATTPQLCSRSSSSRTPRHKQGTLQLKALILATLPSKVVARDALQQLGTLHSSQVPIHHSSQVPIHHSSKVPTHHSSQVAIATHRNSREATLHSSSSSREGIIQPPREATPQLREDSPPHRLVPPF